VGTTRIDRVLGVAKAYVTRVGEGPFPSEVEGPDQERLRALGGEFGTVTGRSRRCGWLDLVALRYAVRVNGITSLALTKLDVLSDFAELPVCIAYRLRDGSETEHFPAHQSDFHHATPIWQTLPGWHEPLDGAETPDTLPKPFVGNSRAIQRNAIASWRRLSPECQILLLGDEQGTAEAAADFGAEQIAGVERNAFGTPLLSSAFQIAEGHAANEILCYANADLIFFADLSDAVDRVVASWSNFLAVGRSVDLDVADDLTGHADLEGALRQSAASDGIQREEYAIDYFVFRRATLGALPPFAVGRPHWDNWMIYRARELGFPVVDLSPSTLVIHQNHGYEHVKQRTGEKWQGPEAEENLALLPIPAVASFSLIDATHRLSAAGLEPVAANPSRRFMAYLLLSKRRLPIYRGLRHTSRLTAALRARARSFT
jgi:hypothetical protein